MIEDLENKLILYKIKNFFFCLFKIFILFLLYNFINGIKAKILIMNPCYFKNTNQLIDKHLDENNILILKEKEEFLKFISYNIKRNITSIKNIFLGTKTTFENLLLILSKMIFYCQILKCKKIIIDKKYYWFINKFISYKKKIFIKAEYRKNLQNINLIIDRTLNLIFYNYYLIPENQISLIKKEILRNIPNVIIDPNELFIYIKSGDIFIKKDDLYYIQPPFCFYKQILYNYYNNFTNVTIISENNKNIIINNLLKEFPIITFNITSFKYNIAYLSKAYNIVGGNCNLLYFIIGINDNIKNIWVFDSQHFYNNENNNIENSIKSSSSKNIFLYKMIGSQYYKDTMLYSKNTFYKFYLMMNFKCRNNMTIHKLQ